MPLVPQNRSPSPIPSKVNRSSSLSIESLAARVTELEQKKSVGYPQPIPPFSLLAPSSQAGLTINEVVQGGGSSSDGGSGQGADAQATYITEATETGLPNSRVLTAGTGITLVDGGAGSTLTIASTAAIQKAQRVTTGALTAATTTPVTLTWTAPFADANYTVVVSVVDATGFLAVVDIASFTATAIIVNIINNSPTVATTGTLTAIAIHD